MKLSTSARNTEANAFAALFNGGTLEVYDNTAGMPTDPQQAATGNLLVTITLENPAFGAPTTGAININSPAADGIAVAAGTVLWGRFKESDSTVIMDVTVGGPASGQDLEATNALVQIDDSVNITSFTYTIPE